MKKNVKLMRKVAKKLILKEGLKGGWEGKEKFYKKENILKMEQIDLVI